MPDNREPTEAAVLIRSIAERRDRDAFAELFESYAPRIKGFLIRRGATAELAEDLAQDALISVWRRAESFDPARATASSWIFAIARNLRIDAARRDLRSDRADFYDLVEPQEEASPDEIVLAADEEKHVRHALDQLPAEQLEIVKLSFFEGKAHAVIAGTLGIPLGTVKSRLRLAMRRLREILGEGE